MKTSILLKLSVLLSVIFLISACSTVKISSIEKRKYRNGYYVQMKHKVPKAEAYDRTSLSPVEDAVKEVASNSKVEKSHKKSEFRSVRTAIKDLKKGKNPNDAMAAISKIIDRATAFKLKSNLASAPNTSKNVNNKTLDPKDPRVLGTGVSAVVLVVIFAIIFLILFDPILAILMAILFALLIIWLLRELDIID